MTNSPPEKRIRPAANGTNSESVATDVSSVLETSTLIEVRRRKAFARRLPPLTTGRRDPWLSVRPENGREVA